MQIRFILMGLFAVVLLAVGFTSFTHVDTGHVGIQVNNLGGGVQPEAKPVGWYFTPPSVSIHEYPVSTKTYVWSKSAGEGKPENEEITFQAEAMNITSDVGISYHVDTLKAPALYSKYPGEIDAVIAGPVRLEVRSALIAEASGMTVEALMGTGRNDLINRATARVQKKFEPLGLDIDQLYWADIRYPAAIVAQVNARKANEQAALAAQANVATATANANAAIATAKGKAEAMSIEAHAISTNPEILQLRGIEKWDGHFPQYMGGQAPLPFVQVK